jgi:uracil phosphoribosyltransferase
MIDILTSLLPQPVPIHHLDMYREKATLQPVEYYDKYHTCGHRPAGNQDEVARLAK